MKPTWIVPALLLSLSPGSPACGFAPAPLPKRQPRETADPIEAGFKRMLAAIRECRDARVTFTLPTGKLWKTPVFPREASFGINPSGCGVRFTGSGGGVGPWEVTGLGKGVTTLTLDFRGKEHFRLTVEPHFFKPEQQ